MRAYNFSAGPSVMPEEVLKRIQAEFLDVDGSGLNPMEGSHRAKAYDKIHQEAIALLRKLMQIPDDYYVLLLQGGASQQFEAIPLNLFGKKAQADYVNCGHWANTAITRAKQYGDIKVVGSSKEDGWKYIPECDGIRPDSAYLHITHNNTIAGTHYTNLPVSPIPLIADMSSDILSFPCKVSDYAVIYAGGQKNMTCAGVTVVIVRKDLVDVDYTMPTCPTILKWKTHAEKDSLFNTPPTYVIYVLLRMLQWLDNLGGISAIEQRNIAQAKKFYDFVDNSKLYHNDVKHSDRSLMNLVFRTTSNEMDELFVKEAATRNILSVKGHKSVGGLRASFYNAMPDQWVDYLLCFMKDFELTHK